MKKIIFLLFTFGCLSPFDQELEYKIDDRVSEEVNAFFSEAEKRNIYIDKQNLIVIVTQPGGRFTKKGSENLAGLSITQGYQRIVFISEEFVVNNQSEKRKLNIEFLIFHELGHALLYLNHIDNRDHIMNSKVNTKYSDLNRSKYLDDFFYGV